MRQGRRTKASRSSLLATGATLRDMPPLREDAELAGDGAELLKRLLDLLRSMRRHAARAENALPARHGGVDHGVGVDAVLDERLPEDNRHVLVADVDGDDRRLGRANIVAQALQSLP